MPKVFELEVWSKPGKNIDAEAGKVLEAMITKELCLDFGVVLGLSFVPNKVHVDNLLIAINERELLSVNYFRYCEKNNLTKSLHDIRSAAFYLEYEYGRPLAWIHIPYNEIGKGICLDVIKWCDSHSYNVVDGDKLYCVIPDLTQGSPLGW
jgi:hypothetical protein